MSAIQDLIRTCRQQITPCYKRKILEIDNALKKGTPYPLLGGKRIRCRGDLVRFKIGRDWRLVYREDRNKRLSPYRLTSRQRFEDSLKRR